MSDRDAIEDALEKMRPAKLEPALMARLSAARPQGESPQQKSTWHGVVVRWLLPLAASACVAVATFLLLEHFRSAGEIPGSTPGIAGPGTPTPVESHDYLVSARPVGIVIAPNQQPYRIMDVEWLEYQTVQEKAGGPALHTATTRRDVIPVALELY